MRRLNEKRRKSFAEHASPEGIRAALEAEQQEWSRVNERIAWLEDLLALREQQVATGTWPTASTTNDQKGSTA